MLRLLILTLAIFSFSNFAYAGILKVKAKDYSCSELKQIVKSEGVVHIKGFGSLDVYAKQSHACEYDRRGDEIFESFKSHWATADKHFCAAGWACRSYTDSGR